MNYTLPTLPKALSINKFKGNANTGKYQCILVDPVKERILDILPDRTQSHLSSYFREILNAFKYGITNGPTEGFNNKIKDMKRSSYGIRNYNRFRTRILHSTN